MDSSLIVVSVHLWCLTLLTFLVGICKGSSEILCIPSEREALLRVKHHLKDPSNRLASWAAASTNCCEWAGVVCSNVTGHVLELHLNPSPPSDDYDYDGYEAYLRSKFGGEINPSLLDLKHLNYLDLSRNDFEGTQIPSFLGAMTSLTYLNLSRTRFYGMIPHQIGNLSNLLHLDLGDYYSIDDSLYVKNLHWLPSLSSLQYLDLSSINLSKSFDWLQVMQTLPSLVELRLLGCSLQDYNQPSMVNSSSLVTLDLSYNYHLGTSFLPKWIFGLKKLVYLHLRSNNIQGPIPDSIQNLTLLENLDLSSNLFSTTIPDWLHGLYHLKVLNLRYNNLQGTISAALGNLTSLISLDLSGNQLEGKIPTFLGNLCNLRDISFSNLKCSQQLENLDLSANLFTGPILDSIQNLTLLEYLDLSANLFSGPIPDSIQNLTLLEYLDLSSNLFSATIPNWLYGLHHLKLLRLRDNNLQGTISAALGNLTSLIGLDFSNNSIHGPLPRSLEKLSSLRRLFLYRNHFSGNPFESLGSLSKLSTLSIDDNLFQGVVKEANLANLTSLKFFSASGNDLTLKVSPKWSPSFQVVTLDIASWHLDPNFPSWIQSQNHLQYLDMSNTGISDSIPTWFWGTISYATELNLSHNHIHGNLPNTLNNLTYISSIDMSSNQLSGQLPRPFVDVIWLDLSTNSFSGSMTHFLCEKQNKPKNLVFLNLASNSLSGEIPDCWIMWPNLVDVKLQSNYFIGNLPPSMGSLTGLESLHIRNNTLSGKFPPILKNTSKLISLDLGENKLTGTIPAWVGKRLLNLKILRLRSNKFSGHIPNQICTLNFLQILDLAQNNFSGNIPNCINCWNAMVIKNSSSNSLILCTTNKTGWTSTISLLLWVTGKGIEYRNILGLVTSIDLSDNKLSGEIPSKITYLSNLIYLNLSHNQLTGQIPQRIGNMGSLESIDFSRNQLSGEITPTISNLSFLNKLNLSYNHLKGKIPTGTQLQSLEASNFVGNNLCGPPLSINCSSYREIPNVDHNDNESDGHGVNWFFVSMAFGFVMGFWVVVAPLFIYRSWRFAYFRFLDNTWFKLQSCW